MTPYFDAAYCGARGLPVTTTFEQTLTIAPPLRATIRCPISWHMKSVPFTSTAITRSTVSSLNSFQELCSGATSPTLLTRMSRPPVRSNTSPASRFTSSQLVTSACTAKPPSSAASASADSAERL
jgi:hypothetical protein